MLSPDRLCQIELPVSDIKRALSFYGEVFGWRQVPADIQGFYVLDVPRECPYGIALIPGLDQKITRTATLYLRCDSLQHAEQIAARCIQYFGEVRLSSKKVTGYGTIWHCADPDGHRWGLFVPK